MIRYTAPLHTTTPLHTRLYLPQIDLNLLDIVDIIAHNLCQGAP